MGGKLKDLENLIRGNELFNCVEKLKMKLKNLSFFYIMCKRKINHAATDAKRIAATAISATAFTKTDRNRCEVGYMEHLTSLPDAITLDEKPNKYCAGYY